MSMTKKDYDLLAGCLAYNLQHASEYKDADEAIRAVILDLQLRLDEASMKFNRDRFLAACWNIPNPGLAKLRQDGTRYKAIKGATK